MAGKRDRSVTKRTARIKGNKCHLCPDEPEISLAVGDEKIWYCADCYKNKEIIAIAFHIEKWKGDPAYGKAVNNVQRIGSKY